MIPHKPDSLKKLSQSINNNIKHNLNYPSVPILTECKELGEVLVNGNRDRDIKKNIIATGLLALYTIPNFKAGKFCKVMTSA